MKREIKFRGKRPTDGEWVYGDLLHIGGCPLIYHGSKEDYDVVHDDRIAVSLYHDEVSVVYPDTVGQFTGLHDAQGKEIYEGDIVFQQGYNGKKQPMEVKFECGAFIVGYHSGSSTKRTPMLLNSKCKVLGNVYDNPDLLKGVHP